MCSSLASKTACLPPISASTCSDEWRSASSIVSIIHASHDGYGGILDGDRPRLVNIKWASTVLLGKSGLVGVVFEGSYDLRITQRLILDPSLSVKLYNKDDPDQEIGQGLSNGSVGLRFTLRSDENLRTLCQRWGESILWQNCEFLQN
jgi:hypothetical protein